VPGLVREPAVAGHFYPRSRTALDAELRRLLLPSEAAAPARAVVVPHAGWAYSGAIAGETYGAAAVPRVAILLGPNHRGSGAPAALFGEGAWAYPGGEVPIAADLATALLGSSHELRNDPAAHRHEHSLEVQLPFLHRRQPALGIVPLLLSRTDPGFCRAVGQAIGEVVAGWPEPVLLVDSTDLNHYESRAETERKDRLAIDAIRALDPEALWRAVDGEAVSMCGVGPTLALLYAAPRLGIQEAVLVRHGTSGDVTGDNAAVVGYAGLLLR
jgi:AmmeMemoRadiSam system protein B